MPTHLRPPVGPPDSGFSLMELLVTMFVISAMLLGLLGVQVKALSTIGLAKERQQATGLANQVMEQLRALPYSTVQAGLRSDDLSGDPNITAGRLVTTFGTRVDETLVISGNQAALPLWPHTSTLRVGSLGYTVRSYVTLVGDDAANGYWLTAAVSWRSGRTRGATKTTAVRSQLFSPDGCLSPEVHPFSGPCQAYHYASAGLTSATMTLSPAAAGSPVLTGVSASSAELALPGLSSSLQNEQVVSVQAKATTSAATLQQSSSTTSGGVTAASAADDDPASAADGSTGTPASAEQTGSTLSASGSRGVLRLTPGSGGSATSLATTRARSSPICADDAGAGLTTGEACASSSVSPAGAANAELDLDAIGGRDLGALAVGGVATTTAARAVAARLTRGSGARCPTAVGVGCAVGGVSRSLAVVTLGGLPLASAGDVLPAGFTRLLEIDDLTDQARAESGAGAGPPSVSRSGRLRYWNGSGYATVPLTSTASGTYPLAAVTASYLTSSGPLEITLSGSVTVGASATASTGAVTCQSVICTATASSGSVVATVSYAIVHAADVLEEFVVTLNLGGAAVKTSFKATPGG